METFKYLENQFRQWKDLGIKLLSTEGLEDDYATFFTNNLETAIKTGFTFKDSDGLEYAQTLSGERVLISK